MVKIKNMSLKQSFFVLMAAALLFAVIFTVLIFYGCDYAQMRIFEKYKPTKFLTGNNLTVSLLDPEQYSDKDLKLSSIINILKLALPVICFVVALLSADFIFYKIKLKKPLLLLNNGMIQISHNNLDFEIEYDSLDELGSLCGAFEKMRCQLDNNNKQMWYLIEERKRLNAAFSHDLRNPITVLKGYIDYLTKYIPSGKLDTDKTLSTVRYMREYIDRIEKYVDTMSSVQRLEDIKVKKSQLNSSEFIKTLKDNVDVLCKQNNKEYSLSNNIIAENLLIDSTIVLCVLENLYSNAFRYANSKVQISISTDNDYFVFQIDDDGKGFDNEMLRFATEPFFKDRDATSVHLGMGLHISKILCERHNGFLILSNNKNAGAKVTAKFNMKL